MTGRPLTPKKLMDNPGPGAYSPKLEKESRSPQPPKFVITYKPIIDYDNKVPGPCYYQYEHTIRSGLPFSQKYSMHIRPPPPKTSDVPGPGTYDPDVFYIIQNYSILYLYRHFNGYLQKNLHQKLVMGIELTLLHIHGLQVLVVISLLSLILPNHHLLQEEDQDQIEHHLEQ